MVSLTLVILITLSNHFFAKATATLEPQFAKAENIKGTRNPHQFVHEGSNMRMICISRSTSNVDNHIVDTNRMDLSDITPGSYHACKYDELYFCIVNYISMEHTCMTLM